MPCLYVPIHAHAKLQYTKLLKIVARIILIIRERLRRGRIVVRAYRLYCTTYAVRLGTDYSTLEVSRTRTRYDRAKTETVSAVTRGELFRSVINASRSRSNLQALTV